MKNRMIVLGLAFGSLLLGSPGTATGQSIFRSTQAANLPTTTMLPRGAWMFEVSHRFDVPISDGVDALWGLDGPVFNRLGLTYAVREQLMLGVLRSNLDDNLELNAKFRAWASDADSDLPIEVAGQGGIAWNTDVFEVLGAEDNEMQVYVQLIGNVQLTERLAFGVVPAFLRNRVLTDDDPESAFVLGVNGQIYTEGAFSFFGEWVFSEETPAFGHDGGSFGVEIRTRGHFFKILVTNQSRLNPTQVLAGSPLSFDPDNWRLGFNLTRLLPL